MTVSRRAERQKLRLKGESDEIAGKSIDAFQDLEPKDFGVTRLNEADRANYEIGWRASRFSDKT